MAAANLTLMRNRVLEKLYVLVAGETAEAEDAEIVERVIANVNEELRESEICHWADSATPQHLVEWLAHYYANFLADDYMDAGEAQAFKNHPDTGMRAAKAKIRALTASKERVDVPTRGSFF